MKLLKKLEYVKQLIKDGKLNEAYSQLIIVIDEEGGNVGIPNGGSPTGGSPNSGSPNGGSLNGGGKSGGKSANKGVALPSDLISVIAGLVKALSLSANFRFSEDLLDRSISRIEPRDDHYFLSLADELVHQSQLSVNTSRDNAARCDKLLDQAIKIRAELVGADAPTAELIIESVLSNLQRARHSANNNLAPEAGARLARCRVLMSELEGLMVALTRPEDLLLARVCTLRAFFAHSSGQKQAAKDSYLTALILFEKIAVNGNLERSDIFEMFMDQAQHFALNSEEKQRLDRIKQAKLVNKRQGTMHKILAFPTIQHIEDIMEKARSKPNKTFQLTSLGFLGAQSLMVSVTCDPDSNEFKFKIEPSKSESGRQECINVSTYDSNEVLRHIKDLWRHMQKPEGALAANMQKLTYNPEAFDEPVSKGLTKKKMASGVSSTDGKVARQPSKDKVSNEENWLLKPDSDANGGGEVEPKLFEGTGGSYGSLEARQAREAKAFEGNLKTMPSVGLLQTIAINENTGVLEVSQRDGLLKLWFDEGKPVHGASPQKEGLDVLYEFVLQEDGFFRFIPEQRPAEVSIRIKLESFILESASLYDETKYLKSLGLTMYSGLFAKESIADWQELAQVLEKRGIRYDEHIWQLYQALEESPIVADAVEQANLPLRLWTPALYKLVQCGLVNISNDRLEDEDISQSLVTNWSYNRKSVDEFSAAFYDTRTGLLRFEFLVWMLEKEVERAQTQMWPVSIVIFEIRKQGKDVSKLSATDKEIVQTTLAEISDCKRSIDWFCHFEEEQFAILMPGLDAALATMFAKNFAEICSRNLGKLKEGQSEWEYSFGISSMPGDTIEWTKMIGFAGEAQRSARISRNGYAAHKEEKR